MAITLLVPLYDLSNMDNLYCMYISCLPILVLDTLALNLKTSLVTISSRGTPLSQTGAAKVVRVLSTKLTLLLTPSTMRMNVRQQNLLSAEYYQVRMKEYLRLR